MAAPKIVFERMGSKVLITFPNHEKRQLNLDDVDIRINADLSEITIWESGVQILGDITHETVSTPSESSTESLWTTLTQEGGIFFLAEISSGASLMNGLVTDYEGYYKRMILAENSTDEYSVIGVGILTSLTDIGGIGASSTIAYSETACDNLGAALFTTSSGNTNPAGILTYSNWSLGKLNGFLARVQLPTTVENIRCFIGFSTAQLTDNADGGNPGFVGFKYGTQDGVDFYQFITSNGSDAMVPETTDVEVGYDNIGRLFGLRYNSVNDLVLEIINPQDESIIASLTIIAGSPNLPSPTTRLAFTYALFNESGVSVDHGVNAVYFNN